MKSSLITPVYSTTDELDAMSHTAVETAQKYAVGDIELITVDDCSPIPFKGPGKVIRLKENSGYSQATNVGLAAATGDVLICGNSDIIYTPDWHFGLLRTLMMGYDIATIITSDQTWETSDKITELPKFGALFAMTRNVYETLGGFDEQFRGYFADTDYRKRAIDAGFKIAKNWNYIVEHQAKATYITLDIEDSEYLEAQELYKKKWGRVE